MHPLAPHSPSPARVPNGPIRDATPFERWWYHRTPVERGLAIGAAALAVTVPTVMVIRWLRTPAPFSQVSPQCNDFALATKEEIDRAIRPQVQAEARRGAVDPFSITTEFIRRYAPQCRAYPETVRNPGEAQLYVTSFTEVMRIMQEERLVSPEQKGYFLEMVSVWGQSQGLPESALPTKPPATAPAEQPPTGGS